MEDNKFEIESEVREVGKKGNEGELSGQHAVDQLTSPTTCTREKCCCKCIHAEGGACDIAGEVACGDYALDCKDYEVEVLEECHFALDMDWLLSLMCDKWLIKLRDVVEYRIKGEEYFRNPECKISCGCMRYIIVCIDRELKWRREKGVQIEY